MNRARWTLLIVAAGTASVLTPTMIDGAPGAKKRPAAKTRVVCSKPHVIRDRSGRIIASAITCKRVPR